MATAKKKRKASKATIARLRALRKKHGLGEFKNKKSSTVKRKVSRSSRRSSTMAKTKRRSVKRSTMGTLQKPLFAGVTYAIGKPIVNQLLGKLNIGIQDELTEMLVAVVAKSAFKNKIVHNFADAAIIVNTASLAGQYAGNLLGGSTASTTTPAASGTMIG